MVKLKSVSSMVFWKSKYMQKLKIITYMKIDKPIEERSYLNEFHKLRTIETKAAIKENLVNLYSTDEAKETFKKIQVGELENTYNKDFMILFTLYKNYFILECRVFVVFITLLLFTISGNSQCELEQLFPIDLGVSRFDARTKMLSNSNFVDKSIELNTIGNNMYGYLSHKSFGINNAQDICNQLLFELKENYCFYNFKNKTWLLFINDYLYCFRYVIDFQFNQIDDCKKIYNYLTKLNDKHYKSLTNTFKSNGEKTGIGKSYKIIQSKNEVPIKVLNISYKLHESIEVAGKNTEPYYCLEIELIDAKYSLFNSKN